MRIEEIFTPARLKRVFTIKRFLQELIMIAIVIGVACITSENGFLKFVFTYIIISFGILLVQSIELLEINISIKEDDAAKERIK